MKGDEVLISIEKNIFRRTEHKYLISYAQYTAMRTEILKYMIPDKHGKSEVKNIYFDTPSYYFIRRSIEKPNYPYKEKLRLRCYGSPGANDLCFLELKKKYDGIVYKRRESMPLGDCTEYIKTGRLTRDTQIMREIDFFMKKHPDLMPKMLIAYNREAFFGRLDNGLRISFDTDMFWRTNDLSLASPSYGNKLLTDKIIMEIKLHTPYPEWLTSVLNKYSIRKTVFSKYGKAYTDMLRSNCHA